MSTQFLQVKKRTLLPRSPGAVRGRDGDSVWVSLESRVHVLSVLAIPSVVAQPAAWVSLGRLLEKFRPHPEACILIRGQVIHAHVAV